MAFNAQLYNEINRPQTNDANELIETILKENPNKHFHTIVDLGCGNGKVTKQLSQRIPHNKIVAFDIDPNMIEFARNNYSSNAIEYITQDISQSWDELSTTFKELEAKVSLIFSNRVLHWVEDKETAAKNISRLLSNGGKIYLNITASIDVRPNLSEQLREKLIEIPTIDEQFEIWRKILISVGIELSFAQILNKEAFYDKKSFSIVEPTMLKFYRIYIKNKDPQFRERVINDPNFKRVVFDQVVCGKQEYKENSYQEFMSGDSNGKMSAYDQFRFIGKKIL